MSISTKAFLFISAILLLLLSREVDARIIDEPDTVHQQLSLTSADTTLALPFDTAVTPWFQYPYWVSSDDTLTTKKGMIQQVRERKSHLWIGGVLVIALFIIGFVRTVFQRYFRSLFQAVVNMKQAEQLYEEQGTGLPFSAFVLNINFLLTVSLFVYLLLQEVMIDFPFANIKGYALVFTIGILLYLIRYISLKGLYFLFPQLEEVDFYNFHFFLVNKIGGILLVPFLSIIAFASNLPKEIAFYGSIGLMAVLLFVHFGRGLLISRRYLQHDVFHFFLYICTLELAPSLVVIKSLNALFA